MKKVFYLKTCSTNKKIMDALNLEGWQLREIKSEPVTASELDEMRRLATSYEDLFSKKSTQIKARQLDLKSLGEDDFRSLILDHYSFLKRPVFIADSEIFIGNAKSNIAMLNEKFGKK